MDSVKIENFCSVKDPVVNEKTKPDWQKTFVKCISDKGLYPKILKELLKLNRKKI